MIMPKLLVLHTTRPASRLLEITQDFASARAPILFAATALLACNLPQADFESEYISSSRYETTCAADADCMVVNGGTREDLCNKACATDWHMAISRSSKDSYSADLAKINCRAQLSVESCTDRNATPFCNNSGKCDRKYRP